MDQGLPGLKFNSFDEYMEASRILYMHLIIVDDPSEKCWSSSKSELFEKGFQNVFSE